MPQTPSWVKSLTPSGPQGSELLAKERAQSKIPVDQLSAFLFTQEVLDRRAKILNVLQNENIFNKTNNYFDGRVDRFRTALARSKRLQQLKVQLKWSQEEYEMANEVASYTTPMEVAETDSMSPI